MSVYSARTLAIVANHSAYPSPYYFLKQRGVIGDVVLAAATGLQLIIVSCCILQKTISVFHHHQLQRDAKMNHHPNRTKSVCSLKSGWKLSGGWRLMMNAAKCGANCAASMPV